MLKVFITGSSDGLGAITARTLISEGHSVLLHARNQQRANDALAFSPGASGCLIADLSSIGQTKQLAAEANKLGPFDVVMHNAGLGYGESFRKTEDGLATVFAVNSLAPYILTALMDKPKKLVYLSSGLHRSGSADLKDVTWTKKRWQPLSAYADSKVQNIMLAFAVARKWAPEVESNACSPGWVNTKMGGAGAPGDAEEGAKTQIHLVTAKNAGTGGYWANLKKDRPVVAAVSDVKKQDEYMQICESISGVKFPA